METTTPPTFRAVRVLALLLALMSVITAAHANDQPSPRSVTAQNTRRLVYLPAVAREGTSLPPAPPASQSGSLMLTQLGEYHINSSVAVDAAGGTHIAYTGTGTTRDGVDPAYYVYCPPQADCAQLSAWQRVVLGERASDIQVLLTPQSQPRILISPASNPRGAPIRYAECDAQCGTPSRWTIISVAVTGDIEISASKTPTQHFALDAQGRPRFLYIDNGAAAAEHVGTFYAGCNDNCTNPASWTEGRITPAALRIPALRLTKAGLPRFVALTFDADSTPLLTYAEYNEPSGWSSLVLGPAGSGYKTWTLQLDGSDRPRIGFSQGSLDNGGGERLLYLACDTDCADGNSWRLRDLGLEQGDGTFATLALDGQGRPRMAFGRKGGNGLGYAWCNAACETAQGTWQVTTLEVPADVSKTIQPIAHCSSPAWLGAYVPSLALDPHGNPRIAYEGELTERCRVNPSDPTDGRTRVETLFHGIRFVYARHP